MDNRIIITLDTWAKQDIVGHENLEEGKEKIRLYKGTEIPFLAHKKEGRHHRLTFGQNAQDIKLAGRNTWLLWEEHFEFYLFDKTSQRSDSLISMKHIHHIMGKKCSASELEDLNQCLKTFQINTVPRMRHFLSQCAHESGGMRWLKELASGKAYEGRKDLGNIYPGDGVKFKGAGAIQLTGRSNYTLLKEYTNDPKVLEIGCDYVAQTYPFTSAGVWWKKNHMNTLCDSGADVRTVTRRVNGGYNGLSDRQKYYERTAILKQAKAQGTLGLADKIASACQEKGYPLDKSIYNLVGITGLFPKGSQNEAYKIDTTADKWNDSVLILEHDGIEWDILAFYQATTEPGRHYVINPLNRNGGACLDLGFHKGLWRFGKHRGYRALSQAGEVRLRRDRNKNHRRDDLVTVERGNGINLHTSKTTGWRGSYSKISIGRWSAGCVVIPNPSEFKNLLSILEKSPQYRQNRNTLFDFRLLDHSWL